MQRQQQLQQQHNNQKQDQETKWQRQQQHDQGLQQSLHVQRLKKAKPYLDHSHTSHTNHTSHMRDTGSVRLTISKQPMGGQYRNHELHEPHEPHSHTIHTNHTSDMNHTSFLEGQYRNRTRGDNTRTSQRSRLSHQLKIPPDSALTSRTFRATTHRSS